MNSLRPDSFPRRSGESQSCEAKPRIGAHRICFRLRRNRPVSETQASNAEGQVKMGEARRLWSVENILPYCKGVSMKIGIKSQYCHAATVTGLDWFQTSIISYQLYVVPLDLVCSANL